MAEGAAYAVIGAAVGAAATVAAPLLGAGAAAAGVAAIGSSCLLSGIIGGVLANVAGSPTISAMLLKGWATRFSAVACG